MNGQLSGISHRFTDSELLNEALTHRSRGAINYERLEFLGDSVLNLVVSGRLFEQFPDASEGDLSRMRARIVRGETLAAMALDIGLGSQLHLGEGEMKSGGKERTSILADALEAVFGALYLDAGYEKCRDIILSLCDPLIEALPSPEELKDPKTRLQEWLQARGLALPRYRLEAEEGADHAKQFKVSCLLTDSGLQTMAWGEQQAACGATGSRPGSGEFAG